MSRRFLCETSLASSAVGQSVSLAGDEAHHLARVMRASIGDEIELFDGCGGACPAKIVALTKNSAQLELLAAVVIDPLPQCTLTLAVALPKGDRQHWLIEKCTELGVHRLLPLSTSRGVAEANDAVRERLQRWSLEACKQCGRNRMLEIGEAHSLAELSADFADQPCRLVAHPGGENFVAAVGLNTNIVLAIGPEGGFSPAEINALLTAGWQAVSLGESILRVETAAVAVAAWCQLHSFSGGSGSG